MKNTVAWIWDVSIKTGSCWFNACYYFVVFVFLYACDNRNHILAASVAIYLGLTGSRFQRVVRFFYFQKDYTLLSEFLLVSLLRIRFWCMLFLYGGSFYLWFSRFVGLSFLCSTSCVLRCLISACSAKHQAYTTIKITGSRTSRWTIWALLSDQWRLVTNLRSTLTKGFT